MEAKDILIITPKTKVLQLIETYPKLEDILIHYVPAFKKLKNPILRKTVAKIATLQQAATVGNVVVEDLINVLRKEVGQDILSIETFVDYNKQQPAWFDENKIGNELNITEMLAAGEQPVNQVIADLKSLEKNSIYKIIAPFVPAPLIDKATSLGFEHWVEATKSLGFNVYFMAK